MRLLSKVEFIAKYARFSVPKEVLSAQKHLLKKNSEVSKDGCSLETSGIHLPQPHFPNGIMCWNLKESDLPTLR